MRRFVTNGLPNGTHQDVLYTFDVDDRDRVIHIPGDWRGPDVATAVRPEQEAWINSLNIERLRQSWDCQWTCETSGALRRFLELLEVCLVPEAEPERQLEPQPRAPEPSVIAASASTARSHSADVIESWTRIESWLSVNWPELLNDLSGPAEQADVNELQTVLGVTLSGDFSKSLLRHNGQAGSTPGLFGNWLWLSAAQIAQQWKVWKTLAEKGTFENRLAEGSPGVRRTWFHPKWIPITYDGAGNHHAIDFAPESDGTMGQIIVFGRHIEFRKILAAGFEEWLDGIAGDLEGGALQIAELASGREFYNNGFLP